MKYFLIIVLVCILMFLIFLMLKILPLLTAKPKISVDYLAEYNKATKPANYDPNQNAAPYYEKAFEAFVDVSPASEELRQAWPGDMNETELNILKTWLSSNSESLAHLKQAAQKPYYWIERQSTDNAIFNIELPDVSNIRKVVWCLCLQAKLYAFEGKIEQAFEQLIELHKIGSHYSGPITLVEQLVGIAICQVSFNAAYQILDRIDVNSDTMARFQNQLEQQLQQAKPLNFSIGENIYSLDSAQRMFTDDGFGDVQLIPSKLYKLKKDSPLQPTISYAKAIMICLNHPGKRETIHLQKNLYKNLDALAAQTPWQLRQQGTSYNDQIQKVAEGNYLLRESSTSMGKLCEIYRREKTSGEALITTLGILRHKIDNGIYPATLQKLIASGYLKNIPTDPYSGRPLMYKLTDDDFTLYSVGADFNDNGGVHSNWGEDEEGDQVFWPIERY